MNVPRHTASLFFWLYVIMCFCSGHKDPPKNKIALRGIPDELKGPDFVNVSLNLLAPTIGSDVITVDMFLKFFGSVCFCMRD